MTISSAGSFYVNGSAGPAFLADVKLRSLNGVTAASYGADVKASFNIGVRGDISVGYKVTESLSFELESGLVYNQINKFEGSVGSASSSVSLSSLGIEVDVYQIPILLKSTYSFCPKSKFRPYLGAGLGGVETIGNVTSRGATYGTATIPAFKEDASDFTFAYQAEAGIKYAISQSFDLGIGYKFLGSLDHDFKGLKTDAMYSHSVLATVTCKF